MHLGAVLPDQRDGAGSIDVQRAQTVDHVVGGRGVDTRRDQVVAVLHLGAGQAHDVAHAVDAPQRLQQRLDAFGRHEDTERQHEAHHARWPEVGSPTPDRCGRGAVDATCRPMLGSMGAVAGTNPFLPTVRRRVPRVDTDEGRQMRSTSMTRTAPAAWPSRPAWCSPRAPAASARHAPGPCDFHRGDDETVRQHSREQIRCAVARWPVPGGADVALCIAKRESGLLPWAESGDGLNKGLFQQHVRLLGRQLRRLHPTMVGPSAPHPERTHEHDRVDPHGERHRLGALGRPRLRLTARTVARHEGTRLDSPAW